MLWAACLTDDPALLRDWTDRILRYVNETPNRVPFSDLYFTEDARKMGFQARSVVGACLWRCWQAHGPFDDFEDCSKRADASS